MREGVCCCLLLALGGCVHWLYEPTERATEVLFTTTADGWRLALHHFPPAEGAPKRNYPVIVCHGLSSNKYNWDLTDELSYPYFLSAQGFDTWAVELRASGRSQKPGWLDELDYDYAFDEYALYDVPALVEFVRERAGTEQVHWVGHSMGGIVLYGYLERVRQDRIRSATVVGTPGFLLDHNHNLSRELGLSSTLAWMMDEVPLGTWAKFFSWLADTPIVDDMRIVWSYDNLADETAKLAAANAVDNISARVLTQLGGDEVMGHFISRDGAHDYTAALGTIEVPIFFVAGALDQLAPPATLAEAYRAVASTDKAIVVLSRANGFSHDYGHVDMTVGESAPREVFPLLARWILSHE